MIKDSDIKTTVSPFAIRKGEIKVFDGKDGYVSMNQILQKINQGQINELHFKIIELVNKFEFLTSRQILQLLELEKMEIGSQDKLNKRLEQLIKCKILTRYYFTSKEGNSIYRVYALEKMGKYLLNSREINCKWQPSDNAKPVEMMKKKLAGNQLVIAYMKKVKSFKSFELKPEMKAKLNSKIFKPVAKIVFDYEGKNINFVYEAIRRDEGYEQKLVERMKLWQDFYENFITGDSGFDSIPQLVFLCEDNKHMAEVYKILFINKIKIDKINFYYTTDLKQNEEKLDKSLFSFIYEDNQFKLKNIEAKILE